MSACLTLDKAGERTLCKLRGEKHLASQPVPTGIPPAQFGRRYRGRVEPTDHRPPAPAPLPPAKTETLLAHTDACIHVYRTAKALLSPRKRTGLPLRRTTRRNPLRMLLRSHPTNSTRRAPKGPAKKRTQGPGKREPTYCRLRPRVQLVCGYIGLLALPARNES